MGNSDEASGDGWKYRGRGLIQLTGKLNVTAFATTMSLPLATAVNYLETDEGAVMSAGWFWDRAGLNAYADRADFVSITRRINGGTNGLEDRQIRWTKAKSLLGVK